MGKYKITIAKLLKLRNWINESIDRAVDRGLIQLQQQQQAASARETLKLTGEPPHITITPRR